MPDVETILRNQDAAYWAKVGDDRYGTTKVSAGIPLRVRWEEKQGEMLSPTGETISTDAQVVVAREVLVGSIMHLGKATTTPTSKIFQIVAYDRIPDVDNRWIRRTVGLKRYTDTMPQVV